IVTTVSQVEKITCIVSQRGDQALVSHRASSIIPAPALNRNRSVSRFHNNKFTSKPAGIKALFMMASWPLLTCVAPRFQAKYPSPEATTPSQINTDHCRLLVG